MRAQHVFELSESTTGGSHNVNKEINNKIPYYLLLIEDFIDQDLTYLWLISIFQNKLNLAHYN